MTVDEIRELIALLNETGIEELELQRGENRVRIRRSGGSAAPVREVVMVEPASRAAAAEAPASARSATVTEAAKEGSVDPKLYYVKSPIVGTFYESPSPGSPPFVRIGERVQPGKVLCIIESMKLMNEIEAEVAGIIESKLVLNGQPVEYGEALFAIRAV